MVQQRPITLKRFFLFFVVQLLVGEQSSFEFR